MASTPKPPLHDASPSARREPAGDDLGAWMLQYGPALRRYFMRRANSADADDLVQDVFVQLQARGSGAEIDNVEGYLFRTAANVLARRYQQGRWRWGSQVPLEHVPELADDLSPERILMGKQSLERVLRSMDDLPPRAAQAFLLFRFEHLSQEAVAKRMGVSIKAVQKFLHRAVRQLMDHVEPPL